jgi:hypothetical protein
MQKHWDVMRSDDGGEHWHDVGGNLPTDFGFAIDVHAHETDTVYIVPITSDAEHFPPQGSLRVYRSRGCGTRHRRRGEQQGPSAQRPHRSTPSASLTDRDSTRPTLAPACETAHAQGRCGRRPETDPPASPEGPSPEPPGSWGCDHDPRVWLHGDIWARPARWP